MNKTTLLKRIDQATSFSDDDIVALTKDLLAIPVEELDELLRVIATDAKYSNSEAHKDLMGRLGNDEALYERLREFYETKKTASTGSEA